MTVICSFCGDQWPRDPALEVRCPSCDRGPGRRCVRPSGHECDVHAERDRLALEQGWIKPCSTLSARPTRPPRQQLACAEPKTEQMSFL